MHVIYINNRKLCNNISKWISAAVIVKEKPFISPPNFRRNFLTVAGEEKGVRDVEFARNKENGKLTRLTEGQRRIKLKWEVRGTRRERWRVSTRWRREGERGRKEREDKRDKFSSWTPCAISQIAHRVGMVCMGAVGLPRTFWLLQIPTRKTPGTASTKTSTVIYFYPGSMLSCRTQTSSAAPSVWISTYRRANWVLFIIPRPQSVFIEKQINTKHFSLLKKSRWTENHHTKWPYIISKI